MPTLAIDKGFLSDLVELEKPVRKRVTEVFDEFDAATHTGLHLEKINNARNPRFRSIRIDQAWRGIVLAPETGDVYTLLKVLHHDDAYAWAQRSNVSVNTATGGIEIRDEYAIAATLPELAKAAQTAETLLFSHVGESDLGRLGVDDKTLAFARALTNPAQLDAAKAFLPETQWDVLFSLAAGFTPEEVWTDLGAEILKEPVDTDDLDAAILRSRDRVVLVNGPEELMNVFANQFATWRVYLHPTQRTVVEASFKGPARVTGGPGTGKTVVALHRAHRLAQRAAGRVVLVTTFTSTLSDTLRSGLDMIVDDDDAADDRIEVAHVDRLAHKVFRRAHGAPNLLTSDDEKSMWLGTAVGTRTSDHHRRGPVRPPASPAREVVRRGSGDGKRHAALGRPFEGDAPEVDVAVVSHPAPDVVGVVDHQSQPPLPERGGVLAQLLDRCLHLGEAHILGTAGALKVDPRGDCAGSGCLRVLQLRGAARRLSTQRVRGRSEVRTTRHGASSLRTARRSEVAASPLSLRLAVSSPLRCPPTPGPDWKLGARHVSMYEPRSPTTARTHW
jgi:hypothetical protein